jgi:hypothetical protein
MWGAAEGSMAASELEDELSTGFTAMICMKKNDACVPPPG